jgi:hypothetical protein
MTFSDITFNRMTISRMPLRRSSLEVAWGSGTMVEHSPHHPKVKGLNPIATAGTKHEREKVFFERN